MAGSVFNYDSYSEYLSHAGRERLSRRGRRPTYAGWAKRLKYRSPRGISMVIQGKRIPSAEMVQRLSTCLGHTDLEHRYFEKLVALAHARRKGGDVGEIERQLAALNPNNDPARGLALSQFSLMGQWFFYAVKQLVDTQGFKEDYAWIARRLRSKLSVVEVRTALRVLAELGLTRRNPASGRLESTTKSVATPSDIASDILREHHQQMARRAQEALEEQDVTRREFNGLTLRVSPSSLPKIKAALREFVIQFDKRFEDLSAESIYQLNLQFFEHTETPRPESHR